MSVRQEFPTARVSRSHFFLTLSRGEKMRTLAFRPWVLVAVGGVIPAVLAVYLGVTLYLVFHDDMLAGLMTRQTEMQYAYEDRLAAMRAQVDRVTSRQLLDQNSLEGRVHELLSRQAQIESRSNIIAALARQATVTGDAMASIPRSDSRTTDSRAKPAMNRSANPLLAPFSSSPAPMGLPVDASAFAPGSQPTPAFPLNGDKPRPEVIEQRSAIDPSPSGYDIAANPDAPVDARLSVLSSSLTQMELAQVRSVDAIGAVAHRTANKLRGAMLEAGLSADKLSIPAKPAAGGVGGPFVPLKADPNGSLFEHEVYRLQDDIAAADRLTRLVERVPLRKPINENLEVTSPFGGRLDPFFGRMAMHTGVDLRDTTGASVHATGAGRVASAGWAGGYGNMVEIDHGNGLATRYAHLSAIAVDVGQSVEAGAIIGRVGSTGRSTGSHLHYEVRVDGEPVDPMRFLRAGARVFAAN